MEVLGRRREIGDSDVALGRKRQEALEAARGVFRTGALVTVWEKQRQAGRLAPFGQATGDELIDDDLRAVDEVPELGFPEDEGLGRLGRVAVLERHAGALAERRVGPPHRAPETEDRRGGKGEVRT